MPASKQNAKDVEALVSAGYSKSQAQKALKNCNNNMHQARIYLEKEKGSATAAGCSSQQQTQQIEIRTSSGKAGHLRDVPRREDAFSFTVQSVEESAEQVDGEEEEREGTQKKKGKTHPCTAQFGKCRYGKFCRYKDLPGDTCINFLNGGCIYGDACKMRHAVDGDDVRILVPGYERPVETIRDERSGAVAKVRSIPGTKEFVVEEFVQPTRKPEFSEAPKPSAFAAYKSSEPTRTDIFDGPSPWEDESHTTMAAAAPQPFLEKLRSKKANESSSHRPVEVVRASEKKDKEKSLSNASIVVPPASTVRKHPCVVQCGSCMFGEHCNFSHLRGDICVHWLNHSCKYGSSCRYFHTEEPERLVEQSLPSKSVVMRSGNEEEDSQRTEDPELAVWTQLSSFEGPLMFRRMMEKDAFSQAIQVFSSSPGEVILLAMRRCKYNPKCLRRTISDVERIIFSSPTTERPLEDHSNCPPPVAGTLRALLECVLPEYSASALEATLVATRYNFTMSVMNVLAIPTASSRTLAARTTGGCSGQIEELKERFSGLPEIVIKIAMLNFGVEKGSSILEALRSSGYFEGFFPPLPSPFHILRGAPFSTVVEWLDRAHDWRRVTSDILLLQSLLEEVALSVCEQLGVTVAAPSLHLACKLIVQLDRTLRERQYAAILGRELEVTSKEECVDVHGIYPQYVVEVVKERITAAHRRKAVSLLVVAAQESGPDSLRSLLMEHQENQELRRRCQIVAMQSELLLFRFIQE